MSTQLKLLVWLLSVAMVFIVLFGAYHYGKSVQGATDDLVAAKIRIADDKAILDKQTENDALKTRLGVQHAQSDNALNFLLDHPAQRMLLPSACPGQDIAASGSSVQTPGTQSASDLYQSAFDDFTRGLESDAAEYSRALNACQVVMEWAKAQ